MVFKNVSIEYVIDCPESPTLDGIFKVMFKGKCIFESMNQEQAHSFCLGWGKAIDESVTMRKVAISAQT